MKGLHEFILHIEKPLNDTFKTEGGVEIYGHEKFTVDRLANRIAKVVSTPDFHETPIEVGYEVMIEPSIFHKQIYRETEQDYTSMVDKDKMLFSVMPQMIILYRETPDSEWVGYLKNTLVEPIREEVKEIKSSFLILPEVPKTFKKDRVKMVYQNPEIESLGVNKGDELVITPNGGLPFWIDGKEFWWIRNSDIYAITS